MTPAVALDPGRVVSFQRLLHRCVLFALLTCIARGAPHDFATGHGTSPGGPNDPNDGQPPCHNGSASDPDAAGDSDPVDLFRGELILDRRDLFVPGRGLGVDVTFHYRSKSVENGQFGYGWTFSYSRRIRKLDDGNAVLLQGTNMLQEYVAQGGGAYTSPGGIYSTLHENGNGTFTLTYRHGAVETYDANGCLTSLQDPSGNALTFEYDPAGLLPVIAPSKYLVKVSKAVVAREYRLARITDTIGNEYDFTYNPTGSWRRSSTSAARSSTPTRPRATWRRSRSPGRRSSRRGGRPPTRTSTTT
jgi:YD repeat-containing protein